MGRLEGIKKVLREGSANLDASYRSQILSQALLTAIQEPFTALFLAAGIAVLLGVAGLPLVQVLFMAVLFQRIVTRFSAAQSAYQIVATSESAYRSLRNAIDDARRAKEVSAGKTAPSLRQGIDVVQVEFSYESPPIFTNLNLAIPAGRFTALLGPSGVGKTTILDLLIGLLRPKSGEILIDQIPLSQIDLALWRGSIGYVPQETILLNTSIAENVLLDHEGLSMADVEYALRQAEAWEFVDRMPDGIQTRVGERGTGLSGGQRQRIGIARAVVHRPRLLILDEATAALDPEMEKSVLATLKGLTTSTTVVAISHQPALIDVADRVYRLHDGHAQLIEATEEKHPRHVPDPPSPWPEHK
jgi:ATP-binding cassette subfamily C protein